MRGSVYEERYRLMKDICPKISYEMKLKLVKGTEFMKLVRPD